MTAVETPYWFGVQPIMEQRITGLRLIWPDDDSPAEMARDIAATVPQRCRLRAGGGDAAADGRPPSSAAQARRYAHLAVIDGGRQLNSRRFPAHSARTIPYIRLTKTG